MARLLTTADFSALVDELALLPAAGDDAERIERIRGMEELKSALCAAQAVQVAAFDCSQRAVQAAQGVPADRQGRGVAAQVAFAMRTSHYAGQRFVGWAKIAPAELPDTFAQLRAGRTSEWKAMIVARETGMLSREHRRIVDAELAPRLESLGVRQVDAEARRAAYRLDPSAAVARARHAHTERRVTCRPLPDTMARIGVEASVADAVACYAALREQADSLIAAGDPRGRAQLMSDLAVQRLTGPAMSTGGGTGVGVVINLIMTDTSLLAPVGTPGREEPAILSGFGPIPAGVARALATCTRDSTGSSPPRWIRRVYRHPSTGQLAAMDSKAREFTVNQRLFIEFRDQTCRSPWCNAPIRHIDHIYPWAQGGTTKVGNGQGYCAACNYAKQAAGWTTTANADGTITTRTPTGHTYVSRPPHPPGGSTRAGDDGDQSAA